MIRRQPPCERGAATVLVVALAGVLLLVGAAAGVVAAIMVAHRQAQSAADLAALAGATALSDRTGDPCAAAGDVAAANGASLDSCAVDGEDVLVSVVVRGPRWLGQDDDLVGRARAGPVS
ncbi:Rv3654c family TadE-like protein [Nocardioides sp. SYSU DS0651]|uniref:Rv3654c family TadE-like protein n=1 Tax=Nocardioides sp. SYSU DS0651 TaxID=3415955 RepID=UPI003F4BA226